MSHGPSPLSHSAATRRLRCSSVAIDWLSVSVAWLIFDVVRYHIVGTGFDSAGAFLCSPKVLASQMLFPPVMLALYWLSGYYAAPLSCSRISTLISTATTAFAGTMLVLMAMLLNDLTPRLADDYLLLGSLFGLLLTVVYIPRFILLTRVIRRFRRGQIICRTAEVAVGCPTNLPHHCQSKGRMTIVMTGSAEEALKAAEAGQIDCFLLRQATGQPLEELMPAVATLLPAGMPIYLDRGHTPLTSRRSRHVDLGARPYPDLSRGGLTPSARNFKRVGDVVAGTAAAVVTAPLVLLLAVAVKLTSPGPAFYLQRRVGLHRRPFYMIKLRTMVDGAEDRSGPALSADGDPRVTPLGRLLRKYRLDELPQFINVLRGDMSIVGPRPERPFFAECLARVEPLYTLVHQMRPGITSLGMVRYGYASSIDEMVERLPFDLLYLENAGFIIDMKIIFHTIHTVAAGKGL